MRVLKLDAAYRPMEIIPWEEAFRLLFLEKAEVVEEYENAFVRSTDQEFNVPMVIKLARVVSQKEKFANFSRENVYLRDKYTCQYCGAHGPEITLTYDHVLPVSRGGKTEWDNIVTACDKCNRKKGSKTPKEAGMPLMSLPFQPKWTPKVAIKMKSNDPDEWNNYVTY